NQGVHTVDLLVWLLGDVAHVQARMATALHAIEAEDTLVALLEFANGALGVLETSTSIYPGYARRLELTGSQDTLILVQHRLVGAHLRTLHVDLAAVENGGPSESASSPVLADARGHQAVLEDFIRAIRNSSRAACDGREARRSLALVEAIYRACRTRD